LGILEEDYFGDDTPLFLKNEDFTSSYFKPGQDIGGTIRGHRITIEYFEPKGIKKKKSMNINRIIFYYAGLVDPMIIKE